MRNRYGLIGVAGLAAAVVLIALPWLGGSATQASAAAIFRAAIDAASHLQSVHMQIRARTNGHDNFEQVDLGADFVAHDLWKDFGPPPRWRVEKPGRVTVMDGAASTLFVQTPAHPEGLVSRGGPDTGYVNWMLDLLDVHRVLDTQLRLADELGWETQVEQNLDAAGDAVLVVTVEAKAQGDFTNDYTRNKTINASDNLRVYRFDAQTHHLLGLTVAVHTDRGNVRVLEITDIAYNVPLSDDLFTLRAPPGAFSAVDAEILPDNDKYARMTPHEVATAVFTACQIEDWDEVLKFAPIDQLPDGLKAQVAGLELMSIGEPFQSGEYVGWYVPYEIRLRNGELKSGNLSLRKDNAAGRYVFDGGF